MRLVTGRINVDVAYKKVSAATLVPRPVVINRDLAGNLVFRARKLRTGEIVLPKAARESGDEDDSGFHYVYVDSAGKEVAAKEIRYLKVLENGSETEFSPFTRSAEIKVIKEVSSSAMNSFLVESMYELFSPEAKKYDKARDSIISALYQEAERYMKEDLMGIGLFSWGGLIQYYCVIYPVMSASQFVWVLKLTQAKIEYQHLMEVPIVNVSAERPPTLSELPPIEAMV